MNCLLCQTPFVPELNWSDFWRTENVDIPICSTCAIRFIRLQPPFCESCHRQIRQAQAKRCEDCQKWAQYYPHKLLNNTSVYAYDSAFHDLMVAYKRRGDYVLWKVLTFLIRPHLRQMNFDYYVPLPSSPEHLLHRGFDTIKSIYEPLVPLTFALTKKSGVAPQGEKNRRERLMTPQTFLTCDNIKLSGRVLLLDDIYTTGRTLYHARDALLQANPDLIIESLTISR